MTKLVGVSLEALPKIRRRPEIEQERRTAVRDLLEDNSFDVEGDFQGPFRLHLSIVEHRLLFDLQDENGTPLLTIPVPLAPLASIVRDYFTVCETYFSAIKTAPDSRVEALDAGRKAVHDEGAIALKETLESRKITMDTDTARRLFTLICVLHIRNMPC